MARDQVVSPKTQPYLAPSLLPVALQFSGPGPGQVNVQQVEICQAIQSDDNLVTLVAGKPTLVRVFVDQSGVSSVGRLRGELAVRASPQGPATYLPALNDLVVDPHDGASLAEKRSDIGKSINFRLPLSLTQAGTLHIEVNRLWQAGAADVKVGGSTTSVKQFQNSPPLRIRCLGLRYRDAAGNTHTPDAVHFAYLRSFLERAYPVPAVVWSQIVVDADFSAPFNDDTVVQANMQIAAIRSSEVNSGMDPRTHYLGLVDDAGGVNFMRGRAMGIPDGPKPDTVAASPCGVPRGFAGDDDLSYADWYGAHELGHTFGRFHPGFPPGAQDASDKDFPFEQGQLSNSDHKYVGYDLGDPTLGIQLQALSGTDHHDLMTYADKQWICAYTFEGIRKRLAEEDTAFAPPVA